MPNAEFNKPESETSQARDMDSYNASLFQCYGHPRNPLTAFSNKTSFVRCILIKSSSIHDIHCRIFAIFECAQPHLFSAGPGNCRISKGAPFMKAYKFAPVFAFLLLACGCIPIQSFHPLWDEQHATFEPGLLGEWFDTSSDEEDSLTFAKTDGKTYLATYSEKDKKSGKTKISLYTAKLVRLNKHLFIDFINNEDSLEKRLEGEAYLSMIPTHFFAKIELQDTTMKLTLLDDEKFEKKVAKEKINLPILKQEDLLLLTAETSKIQDVLKQYAEDKELWGEPSTMKRKTK
jgi:hypothetical protein